MSTSAEFSLDLAERQCAGEMCDAMIFGPLGAKCVDCAHRAEEQEWTRLVRAEYAQVFRSLPDTYHDRTFAHRSLHAMVKSEQAVDEAQRLGARSTIIRGTSATGKTTLAACILNRKLQLAAQVDFAKRDWDAEMRRLRRAATSRYMRAFALGSFHETDASVREARDADLLIVDDLGLEPHGFAPTIIDIVISRLDRRRQTIVTTHLPYDAAGKETIESRYGEGFIRRLLEVHGGIESAVAGT